MNTERLDQDDAFLALFEKAFGVRHEQAYPMSDAEKALVETAPFHHTPEGWKRFALRIHDLVLCGYRDGEMDFRRMMEVTRSCSLGCCEGDRVEILALTADRALRMHPRNLNSSPPPYPRWQRRAAVDLVLYLESLQPERSGVQIRLDALAWLTSLGLATENTSRARPLSTRTLERWVLEFRREQALSRPRGRRTRKT